MSDLGWRRHGLFWPGLGIMHGHFWHILLLTSHKARSDSRGEELDGEVTRTLPKLMWDGRYRCSDFLENTVCSSIKRCWFSTHIRVWRLGGEIWPIHVICKSLSYEVI